MTPSHFRQPDCVRIRLLPIGTGEADTLNRVFSVLLATAIFSFAGSPASAQPDGFEHFRTRFPLVGAHTRVDCESCHRDGLFRGTPVECRFCHDGTGRLATTAASNRHIPHSGLECDSCHRTNRWEPVRMDHSVVTNRCEKCHSGVFASGRPSRHVLSTDDCGDCHRTATWRTTRFGHSSITGSCRTCHDGISATGKHAGHLVTTADCDLCHSTRRWVPSRFNHSEVAGSCSNCHDGSTATGIPGSHFTSSLECDACHSTTRWSRMTYDHAGGEYPGDHRESLSCKKCHGGNSSTVTWPSPSYQPDCAGCHASDYKTGPHKKHENPDRNYSVSELRDCSGSCHVYTDSSLTKIQKRRDREHRVGDGDFD